jgi:uncharacterized iron-regulated protein
LLKTSRSVSHDEKAGERMKLGHKPNDPEAMDDRLSDHGHKGPQTGSTDHSQISMQRQKR